MGWEDGGGEKVACEEVVCEEVEVVEGFEGVESVEAIDGGGRDWRRGCIDIMFAVIGDR